MRVFLGLPLLLFLACASSTPDLRRAELIDLTYPFDETTLYWPNSPSTFELKQLAHGRTAGGFFYSSNSFCEPEHGGTHLDAPIHFAEGKRSTDEVPVQQLIGPAVVIDISSEAAADPDYRLTAQDVRDWESRHGTIAAGSIVLLRTGWGKRYPDRKSYFGDDRPGKTDRLHFPSYGADAARLLVDERRAGVLGVDTASTDYGQSQDYPVHQIAAAQNVPNLENVANLDRMPENGAWVIALPMKIRGGSGGPVRIVGVVP